jgi:phosphoserine phosphatase
VAGEFAGFLPSAISDAIAAAGPGYAVFDADGTLWREDVGEAFLRHLVHLGLVSLPGRRDPYAAYEEAVARDKRTGYAYAAQLHAGLAAARVQAEAARFAAQWVPLRLIASTSLLLTACRGAGLVPVVVSASQIDIVRAAVIHAGIPWDRCAGMCTALDAAGRYTENLIEPLTYAEGKLTAAARAGWGPIRVAAGDSITGDLALLSAAAVPVVVAPASGSALAEEAKKRGWGVIG